MLCEKGAKEIWKKYSYMSACVVYAGLSHSRAFAIVKSLPTNKTLDQTKFKAFADDNYNVTQIAFFFFFLNEQMLLTSIFSFSHNVF